MSWARRIAFLSAALAASQVGGCARPETLKERLAHCDADQVDCVNDVILKDAGTNALLGGIIGAAAGTAVAVATKNPHILVRTLAGAGLGAAAGGFATYYLEHQEASAIQDIKARNRQFAEQVEVYRRRDDQLEQQSKLTIDGLAQSRELTKKLLEENRKLAAQASEAESALKESLRQFEIAVKTAYRTIPPNIDGEIKTYDMKVGVISGIAENANTRAANIQKVQNDGILR